MIMTWISVTFSKMAGRNYKFIDLNFITGSATYFLDNLG